MGGDHVLVAELFDIFAEDAPARIEEMRNALADADPVALCNAAHSLKGAAANLHAVPLATAAAKVERCARIGDLRGAGMAFDTATDALQNALASMRRLDLSPAAGR